MDKLVHDLREPLRSINVFVELLQESAKEKPEAEAAQYLAEIHGGAARMQELMDGLSAYSLAVHEASAGPSTTSLQSALKIVLANMDEKVQAANASITSGNLPRVALSLERAMQLFEQLIGNALKFRSEAKPVIQISACEQEAGMWAVSVVDNGIGIPPEQLTAVFRPFVRVEGKRYPGAGMGLAICRKIVEAHGGTMWMESTPGKGSTCTFTLPGA